MRALVWDGTAARVIDRDPPSTTAGMAVVEVRCAGICNTDLEIIKGYMGFHGTLGHEFVGDVVEGPAAWLGRRVVGEINFACGRCELCARGLGRHCPTRTVMGIVGADGALAERVAVPVANLHAVAAGVDDEEAVFAEPLAAAFAILEQVRVSPGTSALVFGDGKLGLLIAQVLHQAGARVLAVGKHEEKLALLRAQGIATEPVRPGALGPGGRRHLPPPGRLGRRSGRTGGRGHRHRRGFVRAVRATPAQGHARAQEHGGRALQRPPRGARHQRDHRRRVALRAVRASAARPRGPGPSTSAPSCRRGSRWSAPREALAAAAAPGALKVLVTC